MASQCGRWDGQDWGVAVGEAVAADPAGEDAGQRPAAAGAVDQDVPRMVSDGGEHRAGLAALHNWVDGQVGGQLPPGSLERFSQPLPGIFGPDAA